MYEELVKELRQKHRAYVLTDNAKPGQLFADVADAIEDLQKQLQKSEEDNINLTGWLAEEHAKHLWIPVTERLPPGNGEYFVSGKGKVWVCEFMILGNVGGWCNSAKNPCVKYWMLLPEPPKDGE